MPGGSLKRVPHGRPKNRSHNNSSTWQVTQHCITITEKQSKAKKTPTVTKYCDIISGLAGKQMEHVTDAIFAYLNYESLRKAELVSSTWYKVICSTKSWKRLLIKNVAMFPSWKKMMTVLNAKKEIEIRENLIAKAPSNHCREACCLIGKELKNLRKNWDSMSYTESRTAIGHVDFEHRINMNGQWIVRSQNGRAVEVRNRWMMEREEVIPLPIMRIPFREMTLKVHSVKINEHFIAASFEKHPEICVWNTKTKELVTILDGDEEVDANFPHGDGDLNHEIFLWHDHLFSCRSRYAIQIHVATLWKLPTSAEAEKSIIFRKELTEVADIFGVAMDDSYVIIYYSGDNRSTIEVRRTPSFELVSSIRFKSEESYFFDYLNGLIVVGRGGSFLKIWDANIGACLRTIAYGDTLSSLRLISEKFLVSCDFSGKVKIWDVQTAIKTQDKSNCMLKAIPAPSTMYIDRVLPALMLADEYQIAVAVQFDRSYEYLYVKDFTGEQKSETPKQSKRKKISSD